MHFVQTFIPFSGALVALSLVSETLCHNLVACTNSKPDLASLLPRTDYYYFGDKEPCDGYIRAWPTSSSPLFDLVNEQGYPWQGIWPIIDGAALRNHRACNWLQENPIYDANRTWTVVKPGATIMLKVWTNNHAREWDQRAVGHYKVYLAGSSMTQIKTADQLTNDRVVFHAPANKYAHIAGGDPVAGDTGAAWLPFRLVDPTGANLPPGIYNFVWTYWWASGDKPSLDYMIPSYSSCFDIEIREDAKDPGFLTAQLAANPDLHIKLIGNSSAPGSKDLVSPWPPYPAGYLNSNYEGVDPSTPVGKRTFQPYWNKHIEANSMPAPKHGEIVAIKSWTADQLEMPLPLSPLTTDFPAEVGDYPNMIAGESTGGTTGSVLPAVGIKSSNGSTNGTNMTVSPVRGSGGETPQYQLPSTGTSTTDLAAATAESSSATKKTKTRTRTKTHYRASSTPRPARYRPREA